MDFKVGEIVRFRNEKELEKIASHVNYNQYAVYELSSGLCVNKDMIKAFLGKRIKINEIHPDINIFDVSYCKIYGDYEYQPDKWKPLYWNITHEMLVRININKRL